MALGFWACDAGLLGVQAALVAAPRGAARLMQPGPGLRRLGLAGGRAWALLPAGSVVAVVAGLRAAPTGASVLTWLALVSTPPLAAVALGWAMRGSALPLAALAPVALVLAWAARDTLTGQAAAVALSALSAVTLARALANVAPLAWLKVGIGLMAALDAVLVGADLLQSPNAVLNAAVPAPGLPRLQVAQLGTVQMGYGDLLIAAVLGAVLAVEGSDQRGAAVACLLCAAVFDLLFLVSNELPATVPVALVLLGSELRRHRVRRSTPRAWAPHPQAPALGADRGR